MNRKTLLIPLLLGLVAFGAGCSDDDDGIMNPELGQGATLRVVHASPDAPAVDVYVEGVDAPVLSGLAYTMTSPYLDLDAGDYNVQLRPAGADPMSAPVYETGALTIPDGARITAVAVGLISATGIDDAFRVLPLVEDFAAATAGQANVRIVHGSADAPAVALDVGNDGTPEVTDFARFAETGASGVALPAGEALQVGIWAGDPLARVTAFTTPALPEANLFLIATGLLAETPRDDAGFGLLAVGPQGTVGLIRQNPVVYALHGSPDAPAVDILVGGTDTVLTADLAFGELSPPVQVPPASYTLDFAAAGTMTVAASLTTPALAAGERYLAIATGFLIDQSVEFQLLPVDEAFGETDAPLVRVVHASPDAPTVDVGTWDGMTFGPVADFSGLGFGQASAAGGTELPAAAFTIGVAAAGGTSPVATFDVATAAGLKAYAVAAGSLTDKGEDFRLVLVNASVWPWTATQVAANLVE